jgi:hypothetical protein
MSPEECRSRARHHEQLAKRSQEPGARAILFKMAEVWYQIAEQPQRAEKKRRASRVRRTAESVTSKANPGSKPVSTSISPTDALQPANEDYRRKAAQARQLAREATTRNIRQRLLDMAIQYEEHAELVGSVGERREDAPTDARHPPTPGMHFDTA